ncbi:MAG TPA: PEP-CTERM sorting domain-containing protein [Pirellulales bacterium]|jgi:hypothetical protein
MNKIASGLIAGVFAFICCPLPVVQAVTIQPGDIVVAGAINAVTDSGLVVVDPNTGDRTILSDNTHGTGPNFTGAFGVSLLPDGNFLVGDRNFAQTDLSRLIEVDRATGNRTIISGSGVGSGPAFQDVIGGVPKGSSIVALDQNSLINVDPTTGNRSVISSPTVGTGPALQYATGTVISGNTAFVDSYYAGQILSVDLTTGNRTVLSGTGVGTGPNFVFPTDTKVDSSGNLIVSDQGLAAVFRVDPVTGNRTVLSSSTVGSGPIWAGAGPVGLGIASNGNILLATWGANAIFSIDPLTGNRTILSDSTHGAGPAFLTPTSLVVIPTPEPSTFALLGLGLGLLAFTRRALRAC